MALLVITFITFAVIFTLMGVGVIFSDRCLSGSCGGQEIIGPDGDLLNCDTCPVRKKRQEAELGTRV